MKITQKDMRILRRITESCGDDSILGYVNRCMLGFGANRSRLDESLTSSKLKRMSEEHGGFYRRGGRNDVADIVRTQAHDKGHVKLSEVTDDLIGDEVFDFDRLWYMASFARDYDDRDLPVDEQRRLSNRTVGICKRRVCNCIRFADGTAVDFLTSPKTGYRVNPEKAAAAPGSGRYRYSWIYAPDTGDHTYGAENYDEFRERESNRPVYCPTHRGDSFYENPYWL